jgi:hypothetical protein
MGLMLSTANGFGDRTERGVMVGQSNPIARGH